MYQKIVLLTSHQTCVDIFCYNTNICILLNHFKIHVFKKTVATLIFDSISLTIFIIMSVFTLVVYNWAGGIKTFSIYSKIFYFWFTPKCLNASILYTTDTLFLKKVSIPSCFKLSKHTFTNLQ